MKSDKNTITLEINGKELTEKLFTKLKKNFPEVDEETLELEARNAVRSIEGKEIVYQWEESEK